MDRYLLLSSSCCCLGPLHHQLAELNPDKNGAAENRFSYRGDCAFWTVVIDCVTRWCVLPDSASRAGTRMMNMMMNSSIMNRGADSVCLQARHAL